MTIKYFTKEPETFYKDEYIFWQSNNVPCSLCRCEVCFSGCVMDICGILLTCIQTQGMIKDVLNVYLDAFKCVIKVAWFCYKSSETKIWKYQNSGHMIGAILFFLPVTSWKEAPWEGNHSAPILWLYFIQTPAKLTHAELNKY